MAFPTTSVLSSFTGADENPLSEGGNFAGPIRTGTNQARRQGSAAAGPSSGGATGESYWTPSTYGPDSEAYGTLSALPNNTNDFFGLAARIQSPNSSGADFYALEIIRTATPSVYDISVSRVINGSFTHLINLAQATITAGERWGLEVTGTGGTVTIRVYRNTGSGWAQYDSDISDSNAARIVSAGNVGFYIGGTVNNTGRMDDFGGGTVSSVTLDNCLPDADVVTTGWTNTPLYSKVNDASDATVIQATAV